jgi:phosphoribosylformimino-5-aminoimidazole carboxamide ribotide isomerase
MEPAMILIPALELGPEQEPAGAVVAAARALRAKGALFCHVVDVAAATGKGDHVPVLQALVDAALPFQVAGGIRDAAGAQKLLKLGADRVVAGTMFFEQPAEAKQLVARFGPRVMAALDLRGGHVVVRGREKDSGLTLADGLARLRACGVQAIVFTSLDALAQGAVPDPGELRAVAETGASVQLVARVRTREQLGTLLALTEHGVSGLVLAQARHEESFDLEQAFAMA